MADINQIVNHKEKRRKKKLYICEYQIKNKELISHLVYGQNQ